MEVVEDFTIAKELVAQRRIQSEGGSYRDRKRETCGYSRRAYGGKISRGGRGIFGVGRGCTLKEDPMTMVKEKHVVTVKELVVVEDLEATKKLVVLKEDAW